MEQFIVEIFIQVEMMKLAAIRLTDKLVAIRLINFFIVCGGDRNGSHRLPN